MAAVRGAEVVEEEVDLGVGQDIGAADPEVAVDIVAEVLEIGAVDPGVVVAGHLQIGITGVIGIAVVKINLRVGTTAIKIKIVVAITTSQKIGQTITEEARISLKTGIGTTKRSPKREEIRNPGGTTRARNQRRIMVRATRISPKTRILERIRKARSLKTKRRRTRRRNAGVKSAPRRRTPLKWTLMISLTRLMKK